MEITEEVKQILDQSNGPLGIVEAIEISHSKWPRVLRYVSNSNIPLMLTHENGQSYQYVYAQIKIERSTDSETLEQELNFVFGDLGGIVPELVDLFIKDEVIEYPLVTYRAYFMGKYDTPIFIARDLELDKVTRDWKGASCQSKAPSLNELGNGEVYTASSDPALIGFY